MNDFEKVIHECEKQVMCQKCPYYNHNTGACIFHGSPNRWEIPTINMYMKLGESEPPKKKKGVK